MKYKIITALALATLMPIGAAWGTDLQSVEQARKIIAPFYDALNDPQKKDVKSLMEQATTSDWVSCSSDDKCVAREQAIQFMSSISNVVPDLKWEIKDVLVSGDHVVVRSEATGTPVVPFLVAAPTGKSFKIMAVDIQQIADGKIARSYHLEDWASASRQLSGQ